MSEDQTDYTLIAKQVDALTENETDTIANLANTAALLFTGLEDINWAGFYLLKGEELVLGPFQGNPACVRIPRGRGVCGAAAERREALVVADVHQFPGHIACDAASNSEVVVPMIDPEKGVVGVLDIDSPSLNRFSEADKSGLQPIVDILIKRCNFV